MRAALTLLAALALTACSDRACSPEQAERAAAVFRGCVQGSMQAMGSQCGMSAYKAHCKDPEGGG